MTHRIAGRYRLTDRIGAGGMGMLWAGWDERAEQAIAVRVMERGLDEPERVAHFRASARAAARLTHPAIVRPLDEGLDVEFGPFVVTPWIDGWPLSAWAGLVPPWAFTRSVALQLCDALAHVHARGLAHLDLRPSTIQVESTPNGPRVRITDIGCARIDDGFGDRAVGSESTLRLRGSLRYLPPEVCDAPPWMQGPWSDLYALGLVLWELVVGAQPLEGLSGMALLLKRGAEPAPMLPSGAGGAHESTLRELIARLLAISPADRPRAIAQVATTLAALEPDPSEPTWVDPPRGPKVRQIGFDEERGPAGSYPLWPQRPAPLVGRVAEVGRVRAAIERAVTGQGSQVVVIEGEPGLGKSRLMRDLVLEAREQGVASGWLVQFAAGSPPGAGLAATLEGLLRAGQTTAEGIEARCAALPLVLGIESSGLDRVLPALLRPDPSPFARPGNEADPGAEVGSVGSAQMLAAAFVEVLTRVTATQSVVLGLDDAHLASVPEGIHLVQRLLAAADLPVCVVVTVAPGHLGTMGLAQALAEQPRVEWLTLATLSDADAAHYIAARLGLPDPDHSAVLARTSRQPAALEMACDELLERGICLIDGWTRLQPGFVVPEGVNELFTARVEALPSVGPDTLVSDVVHGLAFARVPLTPRVMSALVETDPHRPWSSALSAAERARLMVRDSDGTWAFTSKRLAEWLMLRAGPRAQSWHSRWLKALQTLESGGRGALGIERAIHAAQLGETHASIDALIEAAAWALGPAQQALERGLVATHQLHQLAEASSLPLACAQASRLRAELLRQGGHADAAARAVREALGHLAAADNPIERGWCVMTLAWLSLDRADITAADDHLQTALRLFEGAGDVGGACWAHIGLGYVAIHQGAHRVARTIGSQCEDTFGTLRAARGELAARWLRARAAEAAGDDVLAERRFIRLQEIADSRRWLLEGALLRVRRVRLAARRGHLREALTLLDELAATASITRLNRLLEWSQAARPAVLALAGDPQTARRLLTHVPQPAPRLAPLVVDIIDVALAEAGESAGPKLEAALRAQRDALAALS